MKDDKPPLPPIFPHPLFPWHYCMGCTASHASHDVWSERAFLFSVMPGVLVVLCRATTEMELFSWPV